MRAAKAASPRWREAVIRQSLPSLVLSALSKTVEDGQWQPPWNCALINLCVRLSPRGEACSPAQSLIKSLPDFSDLHLIL